MKYTNNDKARTTAILDGSIEMNILIIYWQWFIENIQDGNEARLVEGGEREREDFFKVLVREVLGDWRR